MTPHYLRFADEAEAIAMLSAYRGVDMDGNAVWLTDSHTHSLNVIGTIYKASGAMLQGEMGEYPEMLPVPGFHVNLLAAECPVGMECCCFPVTPYRVWG
jgi:hypothetical protein